MRVFVGIWILKLTVRETSSGSGGHPNLFISSKGAPHLPRKGGTGSPRKR